MPALAVETADIATSAVQEAKIADATIGLGGGTTAVAVGKLDAIYASKNTGAANATFNVTHGLGRAAAAYLLVGSDKAANVYDSTATSTATHLKMRCDTATVALKLMVW
jgi:hypothetical protein